VTSLFFLWGFMTLFNDILIPRFKEAFTLNYFQAMLGASSPPPFRGDCGRGRYPADSISSCH